MSDTSDNECTPPELRQKAGELVKNLLPDKSKTKYNKVYKTYMDWCYKIGATNIESKSVLLAYFVEEVEKKKISTLWAT